MLKDSVVKIYNKNKNSASFLYISLKSRKTYNCKKTLCFIEIAKNRGSYYGILFIYV